MNEVGGTVSSGVEVLQILININDNHINIVISDLPLQVLIDPGLGPAVCRVPVISHVLLPGQVPDTVTRSVV